MKKRLIFILFFAPALFGAGLLAQTAADYDNSGVKKAQARDYDGALADFNQALALDPKNADAYFNRGNAKYKKHDLDGALADYTKALELDPKNAAIFLKRSYAKADHGDWAGAIADDNEVIKLDPKNPAGYFARGYAKELQGDFAGAVADYDLCIALDAKGAPFQRLLRQLLVRRLGRPAEDFAAVVTAWKDGWTKTVGQYVVGSVTEADFLAAAAKGDAETARNQQCEAYYFVGTMRLLKGDQAGAREFWQKCVATAVQDYNEYQLARAELARLDAAQKK